MELIPPPTIANRKADITRVITASVPCKLPPIKKDKKTLMRRSLHFRLCNSIVKVFATALAIMLTAR
jgi:hypothetical protein